MSLKGGSLREASVCCRIRAGFRFVPSGGLNLNFWNSMAVKHRCMCTGHLASYNSSGVLLFAAGKKRWAHFFFLEIFFT